MHSLNIEPQEIFQALADGTRIRIARLLAQTGDEACLCELVDCLLEPQSKVSRHLKIMRQAGLLSAVKDGRWVYHRLVHDMAHLERLYEMLKAMPDSDSVFAKDLANFQNRLSLREDGRCRVGIQTLALAVEGG